MSKKKSKPERKEYTVLVPVTNGGTGESYGKGDSVFDGDFPPAVIKNWINRDPPVLEEVKD